MAKRISELPAAATVADTDELELNQIGTSRKATRAQIVAGLASATHLHSLADVTDAGALAAKDVVAEADIQDAAVTTAKLADLSVSNGKLALGAVDTGQLADGAVTTPKLAANAVTATEIAANAVGTGQLQNSGVSTAKIADGAVTAVKIAANAVGSGQLANDAVTAAKIADGAVTATEIAANAVDSNQLASNAVTTAKIADAAVTTAKIAASAVDSTLLASNAVTTAKIASAAVTAAKIAANAVDSSQLIDGAVTTAKISNDAVSAAKIAAKAVGPSQLADTAVTPGVFTVATITVDQQGRITAASSGTTGEANAGTNVGVDGVGVFAGKVGVDLQFRHIAPASNKVTVALNGEDIDVDVDESNLQIPAGNVTGLGALATKDAVVEGDIANSAVTTAKLADLSVNSGKLALAAVSTGQLADDAVTAPKIADNSVTSTKIAAKAVGPGQLEDTAVTPGVYTAATITVDQQGRITTASNGTGAGEINTGSNVGVDGVGVFAGKVGADLQFRHIAPASNKITVALNGEDIDVDVVESNLQIPAGNVTGLGALAPKDVVVETDIANSAVTTTKLADLSVSSGKLALGAVSTGQLADDSVTAAKIADGAVTSTEIAANAVDSSQLIDGAVSAAKIAAKAVGPSQLADTAVTPGVYTVATITVDQQGRITAASSGAGAGEINTGSNVGVDGVGVFAGKVGADLQFRHIAPASNKVTVALNGEDIDVDVVESNLQVPASNVTGLGALATKNVVVEADIANSAVTTAKLADLSVSSGKLALGAVSTGHLADDAVTAVKIADGAVTSTEIAANAVNSNQLASNAVTTAKIASAAVTTAKIATSAVDSTLLASNAVTTAKIASAAVTAAKMAANSVGSSQLIDGAVSAAKIAAKAVGPGQLADTTVAPGVYTVATITVDQQGRITAASSGTGTGEINTGSNVGVDGVGVFAGKVGADLQFRHIAPASNKVTVALNGGDIDVDVVESNLQIPAGNVTGLAPVATIGTLASLTSLDANGGALTNYLAAQSTINGTYTFVQADSGQEKIFTGSTGATWTIPALSAGTHAVIHNIGTAPISFAASGVTLKGLTTLASDKTAAVSWLPGNVVKLTGELS